MECFATHLTISHMFSSSLKLQKYCFLSFNFLTNWQFVKFVVVGEWNFIFGGGLKISVFWLCNCMTANIVTNTSSFKNHQIDFQSTFFFLFSLSSTNYILRSTHLKRGFKETTSTFLEQNSWMTKIIQLINPTRATINLHAQLIWRQIFNKMIKIHALADTKRYQKWQVWNQRKYHFTNCVIF